MTRRTLRLGWYNLGDRVPETFADLDLLAGAVTSKPASSYVIGLCECLDRLALIDRWCRSRGWGHTPLKGDTVLLWKGKRPTRSTTTLLVPGGYIGPGAGPEHGVDRYAPRDRFGWLNAVNVYGAHAVPSNSHGIRHKVFVQHMGKLRRLIGLRKHVVLVGDFNASPGTVPFFHTDGGYTQHVHQVTHGEHWTPDHLYERGCRVDDVRVLNGFSSDHRPFVATITWRNG